MILKKKIDNFKKFLFHEVLVTMTYGNIYQAKCIGVDKTSILLQHQVSNNPITFKQYSLEREEIESIRFVSKEEIKKERIVYKEQTPFFEQFKKEDNNQS